MTDRTYGVIIIGSGMGGLTTAALLSDLGWKVCVLEQHYTAGGFTHSYERAGYEWDVGVHYIGEVGAPTRTRKLFDYLSGGNLQKMVLAREFFRRPRLIVAEQPTQGLDIEATEDVWRLLLQARELSFLYPLTGKRLQISAAAEPSWESVIERLGWSASDA